MGNHVSDPSVQCRSKPRECARTVTLSAGAVRYLSALGKDKAGPEVHRLMQARSTQDGHHTAVAKAGGQLHTSNSAAASQ